MRRWIASILAPELARGAQEAEFLRHRLSEAEQWLGSRQPEAASLASFILERDHWFWSREGERRRFAWTPPKWVCTVGAYREWLGSHPFNKDTRP